MNGIVESRVRELERNGRLIAKTRENPKNGKEGVEQRDYMRISCEGSGSLYIA
jgi:hypothetical protein